MRGHHENRVDPRHRQHLHESGERAVGLGLQYFFELAGELGGIVVADRVESKRTPGQDVDVEGADQTDHGLPDGGVAGHQQRVARRIGGDLTALPDIGFQNLGEILGPGVAQRHDLGAGAGLSAAGARLLVIAAVIGTTL